MKFIIPVVVGAIIGYITNWLAIKMLFKPHEEKRFLGIHVPFTPGLIPKERARIAKSVGETVGAYLLSPEVVMNSLSINKVEGYIKEWIESNINRLKKEDRSIKAFIMNLSYGNYEEIIKKVKDKIVDFICIEIKKEKFKERVMNLIKEHILDSSMGDIYEFLDERMELILSELSNSNDAKNLLKNVIEDKLDELAEDERRLYEIVPVDFIHAIKYFIKEYDEEAFNILKKMLKNTQVEIKVKESINSLVSQNMNKLIAMFISPEIISDKVYAMIKEYLDKPQVKDNFVDILNIIIDSSLENKVDSVFKGIRTKIGEEEILNITHRILAYISNEKNQRGVLDIIGEKVKSQELRIQNAILNLLSHRFEEILSSEVLYNNIYMIVNHYVESILDKPISSIIISLDEKSITEISNSSMRMFEYFVKNKLPYIVELFNISKVVEDQINSYDVAFAEELILEIAHRELKAITWLGALLGGIMGILTPLLQFF